MRIQHGALEIDTRNNAVRVRKKPNTPEMLKYAQMLDMLQTLGPDALKPLLASGVTMSYFVKHPATGRSMPCVAQALFCATFAAGRPDHGELLQFAAGELAECVIPACRLAEPSLAKRVVAEARAAGIRIISAAIRTMVFRPDGICPEEVDEVFPGREAFAYTQLLDSGRFEAGHVVRLAARSRDCAMEHVFDALVKRQEYDLAREVAPRVRRDSVPARARVAYDVLQILSDKEKSVASELIFGLANGRRAL
eukprot:jgi/Tetstr1/464172/TSEL_008977.t1